MKFSLDKNIEAQYIPNILAICQQFLEETPEDNATTKSIDRNNKERRLDQSVEVKTEILEKSYRNTTAATSRTFVEPKNYERTQRKQLVHPIFT